MTTAHTEHAEEEERHELFREVNKRIRDLSPDHFDRRALNEWVCECRDMTCSRRVELSLEEFDEIRAHPGRYVMSPGHQLGGRARVVMAHPRFVVVELDGGESTERLALGGSA
jgi:hypothetical protein